MKNIESWQTFDFDLGDFVLESSAVLSEGMLHYHQFGALNAPKNNLILLPTYYGGGGASNRAWVDDPGSPLGTGDYCVIIPCLFGAGESSSPGNTAGAQAGPLFPHISIADNVRAQHQLLTARFAGACSRRVMMKSMGHTHCNAPASSCPPAATCTLPPKMRHAMLPLWGWIAAC